MTLINGFETSSCLEISETNKFLLMNVVLKNDTKKFSEFCEIVLLILIE